MRIAWKRCNVYASGYRNEMHYFGLFLAFQPKIEFSTKPTRDPMFTEMMYHCAELTDALNTLTRLYMSVLQRMWKFYSAKFNIVKDGTATFAGVTPTPTFTKQGVLDFQF